MDRVFGGGAIRDTEQGKPDYEGFLSPLVLERYGQYMHKHRSRPDGSYRDSDNWQLGIPLNAYMKSGWRHFVDWWKEHRGLETKDGLQEALCAIIFNASGYLHEILKSENEKCYNADRNRIGGESGNENGSTQISERDGLLARQEPSVGSSVESNSTGRYTATQVTSIGDATGTPY